MEDSGRSHIIPLIAEPGNDSVYFGSSHRKRLLSLHKDRLEAVCILSLYIHGEVNVFAPEILALSL